MASTRSEAQCAATEHRAAEGERGAKMRNDHCELRVAVAGAHEARALWDGASPRAVRETGEAEVQ